MAEFPQLPTYGHAGDAKPRQPLRVWPGVAAAVVVLLALTAVPLVMPDATIWGMFGAVAGGLVIVIWWLFFSRAPWFERVAAIVVMVAAMFATKLVVDPSISNAGMGNLLPIFSIPIMNFGLVVWAVASRRLSTVPRRIWMVASIFLACGLFTLVRTGGVTGDGKSDLHWRWTQSPEERLLASGLDAPLALAPKETPAAVPPVASAKPPDAAPVTNPSAPAATKPSHGADADDGPTTAPVPPTPTAAMKNAEWPGFRGPGRDGIVRGVRIETDWSKSPPVQRWRRPIGPGWSSFAVQGDLFYTQEQRGDDEIVACYRVSTGEPVWRHKDAVRFWESNGGAGPRATPTLSNGRVYTFGATGIVNALDARDGAVIWSHNAGSDAHTEVPGWGFASSPLVVDDVVIVAASGRLVAYDAATGKPRWLGPTGGGGYSSPHLMTLDGVPQIVLTRGRRTTSLALDGTVLWEHLAEQPGVSIVQPAVAPDGGVLIAAGDAMGGLGIRRVAVAHQSSGWTVEERWTSRGLKPYFNDFVLHKGHAFGFDGNILSCIDLADGTRKWKGGRYGNGQLVLLADEDLLLVLSEEGELALVSAAPDQFTELARFPALDGKTWNHPVLVGDTLLVRNGQEMVAFRLTLADR